MTILQCPLQNKLQTTERCINHSSWYLFRSMHCKTGEQPWFFLFFFFFNVICSNIDTITNHVKFCTQLTLDDSGHIAQASVVIHDVYDIISFKQSPVAKEVVMVWSVIQQLYMLQSVSPRQQPQRHLKDAGWCTRTHNCDARMCSKTYTHWRITMFLIWSTMR